MGALCKILGMLLFAFGLVVLACYFAGNDRFLSMARSYSESFGPADLWPATDGVGRLLIVASFAYVLVGGMLGVLGIVVGGAVLIAVGKYLSAPHAAPRARFR